MRCGEQGELLKPEFTIFRTTVEQYIAKRQNEGAADHVSVYIRDLENGPWMGINEQYVFAPASLLKVPIMMALLREAQESSQLLSVTITVDIDAQEPGQQLPPEQTLVKGKEYSLDAVLEKMIIFSDNQSKELILSFLEAYDPEEDIIIQTFGDLGLALTRNELDNVMTIKRYASLFRTLYNASYLNKEMSQKALDLLSRVSFRDGLVAGVSSGTTVAHKFGERRELQQLHDCGIVYHPRTPYLLCIMTRGGEYAELTETISHISGMVWNEMQARSK